MDGRQRPLGIAAIEDKIVQAAVAAVLTPVYESEFLGFQGAVISPLLRSGAAMYPASECSRLAAGQDHDWSGLPCGTSQSRSLTQ